MLWDIKEFWLCARTGLFSLVSPYVRATYQTGCVAGHPQATNPPAGPRSILVTKDKGLQEYLGEAFGSGVLHELHCQ